MLATVYHEGYLNKRTEVKDGKAATGVTAKKWDKRYFSLQRSKLVYYKDEKAAIKGGEPGGTIELEGCEIELHDSEGKGYEKPKFKIRTAGSLVALEAKSCPRPPGVVKRP